MYQNNQGAPDAPQWSRTASSMLAVMLLTLTLPLFISAPSMAGNDVPVDPALVLPPDPVWPVPHAPSVVNPAPDILSMTPVLYPMAASGVTATLVLSAQSGVSATLP